MSVLVHVGVRASNLDESVRFWRDGLGMKVVRHKVYATTFQTATIISPSSSTPVNRDLTM